MSQGAALSCHRLYQSPVQSRSAPNMNSTRLAALAALALVSASALQSQEMQEPVARVERDDDAHTVTVTISPLTIPVTGAHHGAHAGGGMMAGHDSPFFRHEWPVEGWLYGFSIELYDADGQR
ncbi:MAG: hypothetical protein E4H44_00610, partial [Candidatus Aminicenantes bacterium]